MGKANFKFNWPLIGNAKIVEYWEKRIQGGQDMAGTFIFAGPNNLGKTTLAKHLAQVLLCDNYRSGEGLLPCGICPSCRAFCHVISDGEPDSEAVVAHGDCHVLKKPKDKRDIPVEAVRDFIRLLSLSSFLGRAKVGIVKGAERLSEEAANALLKTLEEPRPDVTIILSVENIEALPRTIVSRSQVFNFRCVHPDRIYEHLINDHKAGRSQAKNLSRLALGRPALAVKFLEDKDFLDRYLKRAGLLAAFLNQDLNERLAGVAGLLPGEATGQEAVREAGKVLAAWQGVVRDLLLLECAQDDRVQHQVILDELKAVKRSVNAARLIAIARLLDKATAEVRANVSPRLVLESVAISI